MTEKSCCCSKDSCCKEEETENKDIATVTDEEDPALAELMKNMELEAENIPDDPETLQQDLKNRSLRMLTPAQVEEEKKEAQRKAMTPQQKRAALRKAIRAKQSDRTKMTADQRPKDAKGRPLRGRPRMTQQQMHKAQTGQLGRGQANVDIDNLSAEDMAQATDIVKQNPHLANV